MKITIVECTTCLKPVSKPAKEVKRRLKEGHVKFYCSHTCSAKGNPSLMKGNIGHIPKEKRFRSKVGEYSSFRYYINKAKSRAALYGPSNLTPEYLKTVWESQNGICPYTGYLMKLPRSTQAFDIRGSPLGASLDRIDPSRGYVIGNVEFVCLSANLAKNSFSKEKMLEFFQPLRDANTASLPVLTVA